MSNKTSKQKKSQAKPAAQVEKPRMSSGMQFAAMAIRQLERISPTDREREQALIVVEKWIASHRKV